MRFLLRFCIYASAKILPKTCRKKLMQFLDKTMPSKKYYFEKVSDSFYRGSEITLKEIHFLAQKGIKKILNLKVQNTKEIKSFKKICEKHGMSYINVPINVFEEPETTVDELKNIVKNVSAENPIYVHCKYGEDRTGFVTGLHLLLNKNWQINDILDDMEKNGYKKALFPQFADTLENLAAKKT